MAIVFISGLCHCDVVIELNVLITNHNGFALFDR